MHRGFAVAVAVGLALGPGCGPTSSSNSKPSGSPSDPVLTCERVADVCRLDKSRLGVCVQSKTGVGFACQSQH